MKIATIGERGSLLQDAKGRLKACVSVNGHQYQKRVKSEEEGRQFVLSVELERDDRDELSAKQLNDASNALHLLKKASVSVSFCDLARYYIDNAFEGVVTVQQAVDEYLEKSKTRIAEETFKHYRQYMVKFAAAFAEKKVAAIKRLDIMNFLARWLDKPPAWVNIQRCLSKFFNECIKYGYCSTNPTTNLDAPRNTKTPPREFVTPDDCEKVMRLAEQTDESMAIYLALGLFGGLRPSEALRMEEKHLNMKTGYIHITAEISKTHSFKERTFKMSPTLVAWLKRYYKGGKPVALKTMGGLDSRIATLFDKAGVHKGKDILRHSFGTYQFALTGNSAETAQMMGHAEAVGNKHYRGRVTKEEAQAYFAVLPKEDMVTDLDAL
jgi:integrase